MVREEELRAIVADEFGKLQFPYPHYLSTRRIFEWYDKYKDTRLHIDLTLTSPPEPDDISWNSSKFTMNYYQQHNVMAEGQLNLYESLQGQKWGRKLVEMRERIAARIGCPKILVYCTTPNAMSFWTHMGYVGGTYDENVATGNFLKHIVPVPLENASR